MSYTPGPWRLGKCAGSVVVDVPIQDGICGSDCVEYYGGHLVAESITPSNAKLIAAAPDLLDVVRRCELWLSTFPQGRAMQEVCRAAIEKVER